MVKSTSQKSLCFNRDCSQPENYCETAICPSCGWQLLLKNRYRALEVIPILVFKFPDLPTPQ